MLSDTLWKLEQIQTVTRIQASQFRYWVMQGVALWVLCILGVLMLTLTGARKQYAVLWVITSGAEVVGLKTVGWKGGRYATPEMVEWLLGKRMRRRLLFLQRSNWKPKPGYSISANSYNTYATPYGTR